MLSSLTKTMLSTMLILCCSLIAFGDDDVMFKSTASAPPNTATIGNSLGGSYFVDKNLVERSAALKNQLTSIRDKIHSGELTSSDAIEKLEFIESKRVEIANAIEKQKVFVAAFNVYTERKVLEFPLGEEKLIIITGDKVRIRPWEGPGIKCELDRIIVAKAQPDDAEFAEINVVHETGTAAEFVGRTDAERTADEAKFLFDTKLPKEQLAQRQKFLQEEIYAPQQKYAPFQGKECDLLRLTGLVGEEGNRQLSMVIESEDGETTHRSQWQRHAQLTIFIPTSNWILVRGCQVEVNVSGIESNLLLTTQGSRDRDYEGSFTVSKITGDVVIDQAPIRELVDIDGNIEFFATDEFVNSGTHHEGTTRTAYSYETANTVIHNVTGNLKAHFLRTDLELKNIDGAFDVQNEFGDTSFELKETFDEKNAHRIVSESGSIELTGDSELLSKFPLYAYTLSGTLHTNLDRSVLDDISFSGGNPRRGWSGFVATSNDKRFDQQLYRPRMAIENQARAPGLDLISRGGSVKILAK